MEDFLKDRPVFEMAPRGAAQDEARAEADRETPFGALDRNHGGSHHHTGGHPAVSGGAVSQDLAGEHGVRVETVVVGGRVTRIVVTCSCGKVTEIGCSY